MSDDARGLPQMFISNEGDFVGIWIIWYMLELARFRTMMACHVDIMDITCENTIRHLMLKGDSYHLLKLYRSTQPSRR